MPKTTTTPTLTPTPMTLGDDVIANVSAQLQQRLALLRSETARIEHALTTLGNTAAAVPVPLLPLSRSQARRRALQADHGSNGNGQSPDTTPTVDMGKRSALLKTQPTLRDVITKILTDNPEGMETDQIAQAVRDTGYQTQSKNFRQVVYMLLKKQPEFRHMASGAWKVK